MDEFSGIEVLAQVVRDHYRPMSDNVEVSACTGYWLTIMVDGDVRVLTAHNLGELAEQVNEEISK